MIENAFPEYRFLPSGEPICPGMTLLDYFAAKAMNGLIASPRGTPNGADATDEYYARMAYLMADAMMKEREKIDKYRIKPRTVKREGWVNIYRTYNPETPELLCCIHPTEKVAKAFAAINVVATVKVEWEEEV